MTKPVYDPSTMAGPDGKPLRGVQQTLAFEHFEDAYMDASNGGTLPADARQVGYALRRRTGLGDLLDIEYVATSPAGRCLLDKYIERVDPDAADWDIVRAPRGNLIQPNGDTIALGTLSIRDHISLIEDDPDESLSRSFTVADPFPEFGPGDDYGQALYIEKAGFNAMLRADGLPRRRDLAIASSQGFSVDAARTILDWLSVERSMKPLVAHDFDLYGLGIWAKIEDQIPAAIDLGLRWEDIESFDAAGDLTWMAEMVTYKFDPIPLLADYGATADEAAFLCTGYNAATKLWEGRRVELNALVGPVFIAWLERKLDDIGATKVVPDVDILEAAYRRAYALRKINAVIASSWPGIRDAAEEMDVPDDLVSSVTDTVDNDPMNTWRDGINVRVAEDESDEDDDDE